MIEFLLQLPAFIDAFGKNLFVHAAARHRPLSSASAANTRSKQSYMAAWQQRFCAELALAFFK